MFQEPLELIGNLCVKIRGFSSSESSAGIVLFPSPAALPEHQIRQNAKGRWVLKMMRTYFLRIPPLSEFEIERELQLPRDTRFVGGSKRRKWWDQCPVVLVQSNDVCMVKKIKRLYDKV